MAEENLSEVSQEEPKGALWKMQAVIFEPKNAFLEIARNPTWTAPFFVNIVLSAATILAMLYFIGGETLARLSIASSGQQLPEEQMDFMVSVMTGGYIVGGFLGPAVFLLLVALIYWPIYLVAGGEMTYRKSFSVVNHSWVPYSLISFVLTTLVVASLGEVEDFNPQDPIPAVNLGFLFDQGESPLLYALGNSINWPFFYALGLLGIGMTVVGRKKSVGSGILLAFIPYLLVVMIRLVWVAATS